MADRGDTHYHLPSMNRWFTVSSLLLLVTAVWMVLDDWDRPWKKYQREFRDIEVARARAELEQPEAQLVLADEIRLLGLLGQTEEKLAERKEDIAAAREELRQLRAQQFKITEAEKVAKQEYNWDRWKLEEHRIHYGQDEVYLDGAAKLQLVDERKAGQGLEKLRIDAEVLGQEDVIAGILREVEEFEKQLKDSTKSIDLVRKKLAMLAPEDMPTKVANIVRDFPGLDFIGPNLKVNKVIPPNLTFELNFTKKPRVDMCQTCHVPIDRAGFDELAQPFTSHPRLDLFLSAKSPHPLTEMGCTICHRGSGEALDFVRTDHMASSEAEGDRWYEEYHWHKKHYWDYPMLGSQYIEASCVQCHKETLDLIAPEAPKVAAGYELFERYGCYSCHKVEWFPTKRRPGPSLAAIESKVSSPDFIDAWIGDPKGFRPTTWMPQIFHLENYSPETEVVVSEYGTGRPIMGDEWSSTAVAAVSTFIKSRSSDQPEPAIPVAGDAERGREVLRVSGCLACHNMAPYTLAEQEEEIDLANERRGLNEHGPNLRGIATKVTPEWLYTWIKDPAAYWAETRMPNLRLSDQEAADIVAYVFDDPDEIFDDVPEGWAVAPAPYDMEVLREQARWFFNRLVRSELDRRFEQEWADPQTLLTDVGERWILNQGCHSCHEIPGLEDAQPIGTELTNWASKTVDKLDYGFLADILGKEHGWDYHKKTEFKQYRENFLTWKLRNPRIFDRDKVKNPFEKLRMPYFGLTEEEIEDITTFVVGLVDDEVERARMVPTAAQTAMNTGLRVMRQKNCAACHVIEPGTVEWEDVDGDFHRAHGQFFVFEDDVLPPPLEGFQEYVADYVQYMREDYDEEFELEEVYLELLEPTPGLGDTGTSVPIENVASITAQPAWGGGLVDVITDYYLYEDDVEDVDGERRSYAEEDYTKVRWTFAPPVLTGEGDKLQPEWFYRFLKEPVTIRPQMRVKMPTFNWAEGEAEAVADYFAQRAKLDWPRRYARKLLLATGATPETIAGGMVVMGLSGVSVSQVQGIVDGDSVSTEAGLSNLLAWGNAQGFSMDGPINPFYETIPQRTQSGIEPFLAQHPNFFSLAWNLVTEGPNCVQCHAVGDTPPTNETPIGWAPDLTLAQERLRPDWVRDFLTDPAKIYPGTTMPANFPLDEEQWQDLYAAPSREQIEAVLTWLFNLDRHPVQD